MDEFNSRVADLLWVPLWRVRSCDPPIDGS